MAKEKIIYLGPEEEMTNVRERLENTNAGYIILVIPPQTHYAVMLDGGCCTLMYESLARMY